MPVVQPTKSIQQQMIELDEKFLQFPIKTKIGDNSPEYFGGLSESEKQMVVARFQIKSLQQFMLKLSYSAFDKSMISASVSLELFIKAFRKFLSTQKFWEYFLKIFRYFGDRLLAMSSISVLVFSKDKSSISKYILSIPYVFLVWGGCFKTSFSNIKKSMWLNMKQSKWMSL